MTSEDTVLLEIQHLRTDMGKIDKRMDRIETAVNLVASQSNRIDGISLRLGKLENWNSIQEDDIKTMSRFQASCPRDNIEKEIKAIRSDTKATLKNQWVAIGILATAFIATGVWKVV